MVYYDRINSTEVVINLSKKKNVQINISIPSDWKEELERLARIYSVEEDATISALDLMRRAIKEKYNLDEE